MAERPVRTLPSVAEQDNMEAMDFIFFAMFADILI